MPRGLNAYDSARIQGQLWTPLLLRGRAMLGLWLDADDKRTIVISTGVSTWRDKSGFGRDAVQATGADQPAWSATGGPLSRGVMQPSAINKRMTCTVAASTFPNGMNMFSAWAKTGASVGTDSNAAPAVRTSGNKPAPYDAWDATRFIGDGSAYTSLGGFTNLSTASSFRVHRIQATSGAGSAVREWFDGATNGLVDSGSYGDSATTIGIFGRTTDGATGMIGSVGEIIFTHNVTEREASLVEGYLAWKWGTVERLVVSHPFKNRPPVIGD